MRTAFPFLVTVLDRSGRRLLDAITESAEVERGQVIAHEGKVGPDFLAVGTGRIKLWKALPGRRRQIIAFRGPGDPITVHRRDTPWPSTAQALTRGVIYRIQWVDLQHLARRYPVIDRTLFDLACDEVTALQDRVLLLGRKTTEEKLASFLLEVGAAMTLPSGSSREVMLPMRRPEIAEYLGLTAESVSRELTRLKHERIIAMPRPSVITLLNRPALKAIAVGSARMARRPAFALISAARRNEPIPESARLA